MKSKILFLFFIIGFIGCSEFPVDEDGLLITERTECYVSNVQLLDTDFQTMTVGNAYVDTTAQVAVAYVRYGSQLTNVWPQISICEDAKLNPKIVGRIDMTSSKLDIEFEEGDWIDGNPTEALGKRIVDNPTAFPLYPITYSVISGNRKIEKEYTFLVVERPKQ